MNFRPSLGARRSPDYLNREQALLFSTKSTAPRASNRRQQPRISARSTDTPLRPARAGS